MQGQPSPPPASPLQAVPLITSVVPSSGGGAAAVAWRGAPTAYQYTLQRSSAGSSGPWQTLCNANVTDNDTPWLDATLPFVDTRGAPPVWYRVAGHNVAGEMGGFSPAFEYSRA